MEEASQGFWARASLASRIIAPPVNERPRVFTRAADFMTAEVLNLGRLLDGRFRFRLTCYQRTYAWQPPQVARLMADLRDAMQKFGRKRRYALGHITLGRQTGSIDAELVDGHQRLLTLSILFAVLRDLETDPARAARLNQMIADTGLPENEPRRFRMSVQALPAPLFERLVQRPGGTEEETELPRHQLSDTERNILDNRECIRSELVGPGVTETMRRDLADFLIEACFLIVVIVDDPEDAWSMISTEEETRLEFSNADQAKSVLLASMPAEDRTQAARIWESCEGLLSPEDMYRILCHIRAIIWRGRSSNSAGRPVETEFVQRFELGNGGLPFMAEVLAPWCHLLHAVRHGELGQQGGNRQAIAQHLTCMTWISAHSWLPPLLKWLSVNGLEAPETLDFVARLDRLIWITKLAGVDPGVHETRILQLTSEIESGRPIEALSKFAIEAKMISDTVVSLRSANFASKPHAHVVLRRLSLLSGADPGPLRRDTATTEHVLPRGRIVAAEWRTHFRSAADIKSSCHRLGNIVILSGAENQRAGTRAWPEKREIFANSQFVLARNAALENEWTAKTIETRTDRLINDLLRAWKLEPVDA